MTATMNATLAAMRQGFLELLREWVSNTTSGAGNAGGTTFPDATNLVAYADNYFNTQWALITASSASAIVGQFRKVSGFVQSTGVVTVLSAYGAPTQVPSGSTYELLRFHPTNLVRWVLNKALQEVRPSVYKSLQNEDLITGNALPNGNFGDWAASTVPDQWAKSVVTLAKESTTLIRNGRYSLKVTGGASAGHAYVSEVEWPRLLDLAGRTIYLEALCQTDTASHARLGITDDDGTTWSSYHTGGNTPEVLQATRTIKAGTKAISFKLTGNVNTAVAYYKTARAIGGEVSEYVLPSEFTIGEVKGVLVQNRSGELSGYERPCDDVGWLNQPTNWASKYKTRYDDRLGLWLLSFTEKPLDGYKIRLLGEEPITKLSADTDTVPLNEPQLNLLYRYAKYLLGTVIGDRQMAQEGRADYESMKAMHGMDDEPIFMIPESVVR